MHNGTDEKNTKTQQQKDNANPTYPQWLFQKVRDEATKLVESVALAIPNETFEIDQDGLPRFVFGYKRS